MRTRTVPGIAEPLSVVGFGCWALSGPGFWTGFDASEAVAAVRRAVELGINFFDVAPVYGLGHAEGLLGRALRGSRDWVFIATKCGLVWDEREQVANNLRPTSVRREIHASMRRLETDHVDLYQMHWPDPSSPLDDTMACLIELRDAGKVRHIGASNFSVERTRQAMEHAPVVTHQGLYNMLEHDPTSYHKIPLEYRTRREVLPFVTDAGMSFLPYSPLLQGLLTDDYPGVLDPRDVRNSNPRLVGRHARRYLAAAAELRGYAQGFGRPLAQLAINWLASQEGMGPVIVGMHTVSQVEANARADDWELNPHQWAELDGVLQTLVPDGETHT